MGVVQSLSALEIEKRISFVVWGMRHDHSRLSRVSDFRVAATSSSHVWAFTDPPKPGRLRRLSGIGIGRRKT